MSTLYCYGYDWGYYGSRGWDSTAVETVTRADTPIVSVEDLKDWLRLDHNQDDAQLLELINEETEAVERDIRGHLQQATVREYWDSWPIIVEYQAWTLARAPVSSVTSIKYRDEAGAEQTFTDFNADVSSKPARIELTAGTPKLDEANTFNRVWVEYVCEFAAVPFEAIRAVRNLAAMGYEKRGENEVTDPDKENKFRQNLIRNLIWGW